MVTHDAFDQIPSTQCHPTHCTQFPMSMGAKESRNIFVYFCMLSRKKNSLTSTMAMASLFLNVYVFMHSYIAIRLYSPCPFRHSHIERPNECLIPRTAFFLFVFSHFHAYCHHCSMPFAPFSFTFTFASMSNDAFDVITE